MAKLTSKFVRVSPTLSAKALEDGKIKTAGVTSAGKSFSNVIKSLNGLGASFASQASLISSYAQSLQKTVEGTDTLKQNLEDLSEARSNTANSVSETNKKPSKPSDTDKKPSPMDKAMKKDIKDKSKGFFGKVGGLFGFLKGFITKFFVFAIASSVLKWISDPANAKKVKNIVKGLKSTFGFLIKVVTGVGELVAGGIVNLGSGLQKIFGSGGNPKEILSGFGDLLQAIPGLFTIAWILKPGLMIKTILRILSSFKEPRERDQPDQPDKPKKKDPKDKPKKPKQPKKPSWLERQRRRLSRKFTQVTTQVGETVTSARKGATQFATEQRRNIRNTATGLVEGTSENWKKFQNFAQTLSASGKKRWSAFVTGAGENWKKLTDAYNGTIGKLSSKFDELVDSQGKRLMGWLSEQKGVLGLIGKHAPALFERLGKYLPFVGDVVGFVLDIMNGIDWRRALIRAVVGASIDAGFTSLMGALGLATPFTGGASAAAAIALYAAYMGADLAVGGLGKLVGDPISDALGIPMYAGEDPAAENVKPKVGGNSEAEFKAATKESADAVASKDPEYAKKIAEKEAKRKGNSAEDGGILGPDGKEKPKNLGAITNKNSDYWIDFLGTGGVGINKGGKTTLRGLFGQAIYWTKIFADATFELKKKGIFQKGLEGIMGAVRAVGDKLDAGWQRLTTAGGNLLAALGIGNGAYGEAPLKKAADAAGIKGKELAAFLAQMSHETGGFNYKHEVGGGYDYYDGGKRYHGRGYVQLTHKYNYAAYGKEFGVDLVGNPDLAADGELAAKIAVSYWMRNVRPTVRGNWDNVFLHSKAINRPNATRKSQINGMEDREKRYAAYIKKLGLEGKASGGKIARWQARQKEPELSLNSPKNIPTFEVPGWDKFAIGGEYQNGRLPKSVLRKVDAYGRGSVGYGHLHSSVAGQAQSMIDAAKAEGFTLGINSSYRSYGDQVRIKRTHGRLAAAPGTSNHGWGQALDLGEYSNEGYKWLWKNAGKFGFKPLSGWGLNPNTPDADEAWHWENTSGSGAKGNNVKTEPVDDNGDAPSSTSSSSTTQSEPELTPEQALSAAIDKLISVTKETSSAFSEMGSSNVPASNVPAKAAGGEVKSPIHTFKKHGSGLLSAVSNKSETLKLPESAGMAIFAKTYPKTAAKLNPVIQNIELNAKTNLIMKDSYVVTDQSPQVKTMILNNTVRSSQQIVTGNNAYPVYSSPKTTNFFN